MKTRLLLTALAAAVLASSCASLTPQERAALFSLGSRVVESRLLKSDPGK